MDVEVGGVPRGDGEMFFDAVQGAARIACTKDEGVVAGLKGVFALELTWFKLKHRGQFLGVEHHGVARCRCLNDQRSRGGQFDEVVFAFSNLNVAGPRWEGGLEKERRTCPRRARALLRPGFGRTPRTSRRSSKTRRRSRNRFGRLCKLWAQVALSHVGDAKDVVNARLQHDGVELSRRQAVHGERVGGKRVHVHGVRALPQRMVCTHWGS